jgi:hypothetical protein
MFGLLPAMLATDCKNKYRCMEVVGLLLLLVDFVATEAVALLQLMVIVFVQTFGEAEM